MMKALLMMSLVLMWSGIVYAQDTGDVNEGDIVREEGISAERQAQPDANTSEIISEESKYAAEQDERARKTEQMYGADVNAGSEARRERFEQKWHQRHQQLMSELEDLKRTADQEGAVKTRQAIDRLILREQQRYEQMKARVDERARSSQTQQQKRSQDMQ